MAGDIPARVEQNLQLRLSRYYTGPARLEQSVSADLCAYEAPSRVAYVSAPTRVAYVARRL